MQFTLNGEPREVEVDPDMPVLWVLRDFCRLYGTRYGCGRGLCGACTVHVDGRAVRSCTLPVSAIEGRTVTTIEGLSTAGTPHPVQKAWIEADVPQCGFCQSGQIMQAAALLQDDTNPSREKIDEIMSDVLCRCGTYVRVRRAIGIAVQQLNRGKS